MDSKMIYARLNKVFRDVFDDDSITVNPKTTANDIEDWARVVLNVLCKKRHSKVNIS